MAQGGDSSTLDPTKQSCRLCIGFDTLDMVACDACNRWYHFQCVGVDDHVRFTNWSCKSCQIVQDLEKSMSRRQLKNTSRSVHSALSNTSESRRRKLALERVEEEKMLREINTQSYLDSKYKALENLANDSASDTSEVEVDVQRDRTRQWLSHQNNRIDKSNDNFEQTANPQIDTVPDNMNTNSRRTLVNWQSIPNGTTDQSYQWQNMMVPTGVTPRVPSYGNNVFNDTMGAFQALQLAQSTIHPAWSSNADFVNQQVGDGLATSTTNTVASNQIQTSQITEVSSDQNGFNSASHGLGINSNIFNTSNALPHGSLFSSTYAFPTMPTDPVLSSSYVVTSRIAQPAVVSKPQQNAGRKSLSWATSTSTVSMPNQFVNVQNQMNSQDVTTTNTVNYGSSSYQFPPVSSTAPGYMIPTNSQFVGYQQPSHIPGNIRSSSHQINTTQAANYVNSGHQYSIASTTGTTYSIPSANQFVGYQQPVLNQNMNASNHFSATNSTNYVGNGQQFPSASGAGYTTSSNNQSSQQQSNPFQSQGTFYQFSGPQQMYNSTPHVTSSQQFTSGQQFASGQRFASGQQFVGGQSFVGGQPFGGPHQSSANPLTYNNGQSHYTGQYLPPNAPQQFFDNSGSMQFMSQTLTPSQIAARQVVSRKLPIFTGDIEKFPAFLRAYEDSTTMCGYTNGENLGRLLESIKEPALEFVEQQLLYADSVPQVIATLKTLFGNPENLIEKLMATIAKEGSLQSDDLPALVKFCMRVQNICSTIRTSGLVHYAKNPMMMKSLVDKLPPNIQLNWASYKLSVADPDLNTLGVWLNELGKVASSISGPPKLKKCKEKNDKVDGAKSNSKNNTKSDGYVNAQIVSSSKKDKSETKAGADKKCVVCNQSSCKRIRECQKFIDLTVKERWTIIKEKNLCLRCLGNHTFKNCKSKWQCNVGDCKRAHNHLLHDDQRHVDERSTAVKECESKEKDVKTNCLHQSLSRRGDIFRIAPVILYYNDRSIFTFVYLDDGSNITMIEDELAAELDLPSSNQENLCVKWSFGGVRRQELISKRVSVQISGVHRNAKKFDLHNVRTVNDLALPSQSISQDWLDSYEHLKGIPITTYEDVKPRMLIGLQYSKLMVSQQTIEGLWSEPIACKTRLGWIVQGPDGGDDVGKSNNGYSVNVCECQRQDDSVLHSMVKEFFSWDNFGVKIPNEILESKDIQRARKILESTTRKVNDRYETGLLWRFDNIEFPNSYPMALKRLECLERKMAKDPVLAEKMVNYIRDFTEKGYVRKLSPDELQQSQSRVFYLPLFPVFNPKKPEKFRVVWDAAAMVNKTSLNAMLLAGPDLLKPLPDVLRRFRERSIAITGDMKEMFHQVQVNESDIHSQRFLWRNGNSLLKPDVLVMKVLTFGGKNSPCSAQYVKNKNALEHKNQFPRAVEAIIENHYQDDMLECFDTIEETVRITEEVKLIHRNGGFEMRNFMSNSGKVLENLGEELASQRLNLDISTEPAIERVLGMFWCTSTDTFTFSLKFTKLPEEVLKRIRRPTKREVLSAIMSIFDPLGLIAHYLVHGKMLLQRIWRDGTDWDEKLSDSSYKQWLKWMEFLPEIETIQIPRWYSTKLASTNQHRVQLHVFVDAGVEACAAAVYYRIEDEEGVDCCLIGAKTKVAPNKPLSVPRLELQAAVLGVRLVKNISQSQRIQVTQRFFWSDSQTVLGWINSEARKFHQYVAFRIGEILENSSTNEWNWVDTKNNVADDATKWFEKPNLSSTSRWYKAPSFLYQPQDTWPSRTDKSKLSTEEEMRAVYLLAHLQVPNHNVVDANNFSNWNRLLRAMAFALRFIDNARSLKNNKKTGPFSREEYIRARITLFKQAQREEFMDEILVIRNNETLPVGERKEIHKSSVLRTRSPYLDEDGLLRMRSRFEAAQSVSYSTKRPIILPRKNRITKLLVLYYHQKFHHVIHQATLNQINQTFHVPALRAVLKSVIENLCQRCKNDKAKPVIPEMAELPRARLATFTRPFTYCGIDYFGPMNIKVRRTPEKRYGVIFTCLTTRAVYIDIAHSYDTSSCILCIRNFENRRIKPLEYYSDNGSNFHGAERELREEFEKLNKTKIQEAFTTEHTKWSFNPPTAAHMGGIWERPI